MKLIRSKKKGSKLKAFADITFDEVLVCRGWKIIDGSRGLFLAAPSQQSRDNKFYDNILFVDGNKRGSPGDRMKQYVQSEVLRRWSDMQQDEAGIDQTQTSTYDDDVPF